MNSLEEFHYGPAWAVNTQCCGKPEGCTNMSDQCVLRDHPWKLKYAVVEESK